MVRLVVFGLMLVFLLGGLTEVWAQEEAESAPEEEAAVDASDGEEESPAPEPEPGPANIDQVQIQVWISETTEDGLRQLGANLDYRRFIDGEEQTGSLERVGTQTFDPLNLEQRVTLPAPGNRTPIRPDLEGGLGDGVQTQRGAGLTFSIIEAGRGTLEGVFRSLERRTDIDLISKPELVVVDQGQASIHAGGEVPFQGIEYNRAEPIMNVRWENIGVDLILQPVILSDAMVQVNLERLRVKEVVRIDNIRGVDMPVFSERSQSGQVIVPNGQTLVIGGLSNRVLRQTERRVPILGRVPLLGIPFRARDAEAESTHLLMFVSPTIVDLRDLRPEAESAMSFWREERWRQMDRIDQEKRLLAQ
ncbi:MAG: type II and III secretion system protein [Candidatus Hydrogenedentota bacterium]